MPLKFNPPWEGPPIESVGDTGIKTYRVIWSIKREADVEAYSREEAEERLAHADWEKEGKYVEDSFRLIKIEEKSRR
jgi:hypothetical protein